MILPHLLFIHQKPTCSVNWFWDEELRCKQTNFHQEGPVSSGRTVNSSSALLDHKRELKTIKKTIKIHINQIFVINVGGAKITL